ncbi:hypothetical protein OS493_027174 [Desmophyllum pertusum]|uniref:START domain-containing protein n=1 Tax=Desmophyllum pertusum TaxID=174260 RepID=A0A9W9ZYC9_9CNID|nr:hypothetical protein OS493_027174 [Desmophyllum pertusum]
MQSTDFRNVSFDEELKRAKWFKDDLDKGGWDEVYRSPGAMFWMKTLPDQEVPIKTLFLFDMPMPADKIKEVMHPSNLEIRKKWDRAFLDHEILQSYSDGSFVTASKINVSWPLYDRSFILFSATRQRGGLVWAKSVLGNSERCLALVQTRGCRRVSQGDQRR